MVERSRLKMILLLIAMAQLATEVTRLASEWTSSHSRHTRIEERMRAGQTDGYGSEPDLRTDLETKWMNPSDPSSARGPPPEPRKSRPAPPPSWRPDVGTNHPPWCRGCRELRWRSERRYYDDWYRDYDDWYYGWYYK
jgi:hypothetical protein